MQVTKETYLVQGRVDNRYNQRIKYYTDEEGELKPYEICTLSDCLFNPLHIEDKRNSEHIQEKYDKENMVYPYYKDKVRDIIKSFTSEDMIIFDLLNNEEKQVKRELTDQEKEKNTIKSVRRAKTSIFDYVIANNQLCYFITITINKDEMSRTNKDEIKSYLKSFLNNNSKRKDLQYILVAEEHKDGAIHFHGLINDTLTFVDSKTVLTSKYNKPVRISTADKHNIPLEDRRIVYNIKEWNKGFSTAIKLTGDRKAVAYYISKYITKDTKKIFGKYFWHSKSLQKPYTEYKVVNYNEVEGREYHTKYLDVKYSK